MKIYPRTKRYQIPLTPRTVEAINAYCNETTSSLPQASADFLDQIAPEILALANALKKVREGTPSAALRDASERLHEALTEARATSEQLDLEITPKKSKARKAS